jgi:iron complex outermembrane recepter protein
VTAVPALPRTWAVSVKRNFGPSSRNGSPEYFAPAPTATFKECLDGTVVAMDAACPPPPAPAPVQQVPPPPPQIAPTGERG